MAECGSDEIYSSLKSTTDEVNRLVEILSDLDLSVPASSLIEFNKGLYEMDSEIANLSRSAVKAANSISTLTKSISNLDKYSSNKNSKKDSTNTQNSEKIYGVTPNSLPRGKPKKERDYFNEFKDELRGKEILREDFGGGRVGDKFKSIFSESPNDIKNNFLGRIKKMDSNLPKVIEKVENVTEGKLAPNTLRQVIDTLGKGNKYSLEEFLRSKDDSKVISSLKDISTNTGKTAENFGNIEDFVAEKSRFKDTPGKLSLASGVASFLPIAAVGADALARGNFLNTPYGIEEQARQRSTDYGTSGTVGGMLAGGTIGSIVGGPVGTVVGGAVGAIAGSLGGSFLAKDLNNRQLSKSLYGADTDLTSGNISAENVSYLGDVKYQNALISGSTEKLAKMASSDTYKDYLDSGGYDELNSATLSPQQTANTEAKLLRLNKKGVSLGYGDLREFTQASGLRLDSLTDLMGSFSDSNKFRVGSADTREDMMMTYVEASRTSPQLAQNYMNFEKGGYVSKSYNNALAKSLFGVENFQDLTKQASDPKQRKKLMGKLMTITGAKDEETALDMGQDIFQGNELFQGAVKSLGGADKSKSDSEYLKDISDNIKKLLESIKDQNKEDAIKEAKTYRNPNASIFVQSFSGGR